MLPHTGIESSFSSASLSENILLRQSQFDWQLEWASYLARAGKPSDTELTRGETDGLSSEFELVVGYQ
jgi:hypothetical protein